MSVHRRFASESASPALKRLRPLSILSPPLSQSARFSAVLPSQFEDIVLQFEDTKDKVYYDGYIQKLETSAGNNRLQKDGGWQEVYATLTGTVLSTWPAADLDFADTIGARSKVSPTFINLMDARIDEHGGSSYFMITTAGNKQVRLRSSNGNSDAEFRRLLLAVRLSAFERSRMQEAYTANLFLKFNNKETTQLMGTEEIWSGLVDARICGGDVAQTQWSKFWCCIVQAPRRKSSLTKRLSFGSSKAETKVETEIQFFSERRDKTPRIVMHDVFAAYACYPEHMSLIETGGVAKLEGNVHLTSSGPKPNSEGFALVIPANPEKSKRMSLSSSPKTVSLVQSILRYLYAVWSAFQLYHMPTKLLLNAPDVDALGLNGATVDLKADQLYGSVPSDCTSDRAWKHFLRSQAFSTSSTTEGGRSVSQNHQSSTQAFRRTGSERRVVSEGAIQMSGGRPLVTSIEEDEEMERLEALRAQKEVESSYTNLVPQVALVGSGRQAMQHDTTEDVQQFANLDKPASPYKEADASTLNQEGTPKDALINDSAKDSHRSSTSSVPDALLTALGPTGSNTASVPFLMPKRSFESPALPQVSVEDESEYPTTKPPAIRRIMSDHFSPQQARPSISLGVDRHDSHRSEMSESSAYSAGLDLAALDLISQYQAQEDEQEVQVRDNDGEESIYSAADDKSEYASTIGEPQPLDSTADLAVKRLGAASALDIKRQASRSSPINPYARPRPRVALS